MFPRAADVRNEARYPVYMSLAQIVIRCHHLKGGGYALFIVLSSGLAMGSVQQLIMIKSFVAYEAL